MRKILIVIDMQNDFIDGALGTAEAVAIVPNVIDKILEYDGEDILLRQSAVPLRQQPVEDQKVHNPAYRMDHIVSHPVPIDRCHPMHKLLQ